MPDNLDGNKYIRIFATFNKYTWRGWKLCHKGRAFVLYAKHISNGYVQSKTFKYRHKDGTEGARTYSEWTQRGRLFLYDTLKEHGILPLIEKSSTLTNEAK